MCSIVPGEGQPTGGFRLTTDLQTTFDERAANPVVKKALRKIDDREASDEDNSDASDHDLAACDSGQDGTSQQSDDRSAENSEDFSDDDDVSDRDSDKTESDPGSDDDDVRYASKSVREDNNNTKKNHKMRISDRVEEPPKKKGRGREKAPEVSLSNSSKALKAARKQRESGGKKLKSLEPKTTVLKDKHRKGTDGKHSRTKHK